MTTTDTVLRQWHMLRLVPRYPQKITVQAIKAALGVEGFDTTERSIPCDLAELFRAFSAQKAWNKVMNLDRYDLLAQGEAGAGRAVTAGG